MPAATITLTLEGDVYPGDFAKAIDGLQRDRHAAGVSATPEAVERVVPKSIYKGL